MGLRLPLGGPQAAIHTDCVNGLLREATNRLDSVIDTRCYSQRVRGVLAGRGAHNNERVDSRIRAAHAAPEKLSILG
jgi:hypothetical protein